MRVLLLGPVTVLADGVEARIRSERQATLLTTLALRAGRVVRRSVLEQAMWGDDPPPTARNTLQVHVSSLRRLLGAEVLTTVGDGYLLDGAEVDVATFLERVRRGAQAQEAGRNHEAAMVLRSAMSLWRGEPFEGLDNPVLSAERERLLALRLGAALTRVDADLALGRHLFVIDELQALAERHPFDEVVAGKLMVALYRAGRQHDALAAYERVRYQLAEELGVQPGTTLRDLQLAVLRHADSLRLPEAERAQGVPWRGPLEASARRPMVGRESVASWVRERLSPGVLVTLVGPKGTGKTRLATELAQRLLPELDDGAVLVHAPDLGGVEDLLSSIGTALDGVPGSDGDEVRARLAQGALLVVLDELHPGQLDRAALGQLVSGSRALWLCTSTRPFGLAGEVVARIPPLAAVDPDGEPGPAAELLLDLALDAGADPPSDPLDVVRCAELLDGLPLALEIAAPLAVLGWPDLRHRLAARTGDDALSISFDTSLCRLDDDELRLLDVLAVVGAPVDLELVEDLVPGGRPAETLAALVRDGLVRRQPGSHGQALFDQLPSVREQVLARSQPSTGTRDRRLLVEAVVRLMGRYEWYSPSVLRSAEQARRWMALLPVALRAMTVASEEGWATEAAPLVNALNELRAADRGFDSVERTAWMLHGSSRATPVTGPGRVDVLIVAAMAALWNQDPDRGQAMLGEALEVSRDLGDLPRLAMSLAHERLLHLVAGRPVRASAHREIERIVAEVDDDELTASLRVFPRGEAEDDALHADALARSRRLDHEGLRLLCLANWADRELERGAPERAEALAVQAGALATDMHNRYLARAMQATAETAAVLTGRTTTVTRLAEVLSAALATDDLRTTTDVLLKLAAGAHRTGRPGVAARCVGAVRTLLAGSGSQMSVTEEEFVASWLADYADSAPPTALADAVADVEAWLGERGRGGEGTAG